MHNDSRSAGLELRWYAVICVCLRVGFPHDFPTSADLRDLRGLAGGLADTQWDFADTQRLAVVLGLADTQRFAVGTEGLTDTQRLERRDFRTPNDSRNV
jgi:hypothetical protein